MATNIKVEFEEYVKKLTTAICKDILLEKMEEICSKYENVYVKYASASEKVHLAGTLLEDEVKKADKIVTDIETDIKSSVQNISHDIINMENSTKSLFEDLHAFTTESKYNIIKEFCTYNESYKKEIEAAFDAGCARISDRLAGAITPELLQKFIIRLEENQKELKTAADYINANYKIEIDKNFKEVESYNKVAQEKINVIISNYVKGVLSDLNNAKKIEDMNINKKTQYATEAFQQELNLVVNNLTVLLDAEKSDRENAIQRQTELIKQILPQYEPIDKLSNRVENLKKMVNKMKLQNDLNTKKIQNDLTNFLNEQKKLEQQRISNQNVLDKQVESLSWKIYMTFTNTALMCLFILLIILQKPWEIIGVTYTSIIAGGFLVIMLIFDLLRKKIAKGLIKSEKSK